MFCWVSKNKFLNKNKEITSVEDLILTLKKSLISEEYRGFSIRFSVLEGTESEFRIEAGHRKFFLRTRPILHPSRKLLKEERRVDSDLLLCPHIPEPLASDLRQAGISHADLNGRLFIQSADFLLDRRPTETRFRNPRTGPDPFSPKASRIVRTLLNHRDSAFTQEELELRTGVSRTIISQVLARLEDEDFVKQLSRSGRRTPAQYQLAEFDHLLDLWKATDDWRKRTTIHQFSVLSNRPEEIAQKVIDSLGVEGVAFTQWFAAWLRRPHTIPAVVSAYVNQRKFLEIIPARKVNTGGNLWLIIPEDDGVLLGTQESQDFPLVSDVQIYLDLLQVEQRGPEQAAELRAWDRFAR